MGMGIPVLHGVRGESADIVLQEKIGEVFEPENAQALVDGISKLKNNNDLYPSYLKPQHCWLHSFPQSHSLSWLTGLSRLPPHCDSKYFGYISAI
jgi:glycosyltransferase involved in cell wall biosynthesis